MVTSTRASRTDSSAIDHDRRTFLLRHLRPHKMYVRKDVRLVWFLNPKVGTTTLRSALLEGLLQKGISPRLGWYVPMNAKRRYLVAPPSEYLDVWLHKDQYTFYAFVRNPYARFLSAWKDKFAFCHTEEKTYGHTPRLIPPLRRFAMRRDLPGAEADSPIPFETFLAYAEWEEEGRRDHHWDTQRAVLHLDAVNYHRLFHIETEFNEGAVEVLTHAGVDPEWIGDRLRTPRNVSPKIEEQVYDQALADRVYRLYECDFSRLRYARDSWRDL